MLIEVILEMNLNNNNFQTALFHLDNDIRKGNTIIIESLTLGFLLLLNELIFHGLIL